ncbi:unnamed protein product [Mesocestoides corti]|uniref:K Homology domain-containing protein n=1 Tax=Mesocestoides corti TaxID=53468 RepID=A0A0R3UM06_MESCO|nr:unnamed protein product [Mesocestoides corti]
MKRDNGFPDEGPAPKFRRSDDPSKLLRVLIPSRAAGPIIGKGGETIKNLRAQDVLTAKNADPRLLEGRKDDDGNDLDPEKLVDLRILIHHSQVGSVIGKSGDKIKELREKHHMQIIKIYQEFAPRSTDRVLQLIGEPDNVYACVENIMETLESAPPRGYRNDYDANNFEPEPMAMYDRYMPPPPPYGYDGPYVGGPPPPPPYGMYDDRSYYDRGYSRRGPPSSGYRREC